MSLLATATVEPPALEPPRLGPLATRLRFRVDEHYLPLTKRSRYKAVYGGRGSGKSHFFAQLLCERALTTPGLRAVCVREVQKSLEQSVKRLIEDKIIRYNLGKYFDVRKTEIGTPGGGLIIFNGMQNHTAESIKSLEGYDVAWIEEAQTVSVRSLDLLRPTIRKPFSEIWAGWNPRFETDPIDVFFRGGEPPPDSIILNVNFNENRFFPQVLALERDYDQRRDPDKYAHIWLGQYQRSSEARVFRNWRVEDFDTPEGSVFYFGADWGFSIDPTVLVRCWLKGRTLYVDQEVWAIGCEIDRLPALFDKMERGMARRWHIRADSSRPETISYMNRHGFKVVPAIKGANSVEDGIEFLKSFDIVVHPRCTHTAEELLHYSWQRDKLTEEVLPILEDKHNHTIDALRYAVEQIRRRPPVAATGYQRGPQ